MLKQKFCLWWIWYLLFDNAHFQRWLAWHRKRGWELAHVGGLFFHFTRGDGTDYRYYVQVMKDFPWTEQGRAYIAGVEELGVTYLGCFLHRAYFRWVDDGRPEEMFSDLASQAQEARCVRTAALAPHTARASHERPSTASSAIRGIQAATTLGPPAAISSA